ncbi:MAG: hypothetical protein GF311_02095, partial [Candidatus Lokiarchaeota archaeon]|nr:hypothetical protein [Candidatus Lokiarchaeota archaeon]
MIDLTQFSDNNIIYSLAIKLNRYFEKPMTVDLERLIELLIRAIKNRKNIVKATYLLSIIAEYRASYIKEEHIQFLKRLMEWDHSKIRTNISIILGAYCFFHADELTKMDNVSMVIKLVSDDDPHVVDNAVLYLLKINEENPVYFSHPPILRMLLNTVATIQDKHVRKDLHNIISSQPDLFLDQLSLLTPKSPTVMKKTDLTVYSKFKGMSIEKAFREYFNRIKNENTLYIPCILHSTLHQYLIEFSDKELEAFFDRNHRISLDTIYDYFEPVCTTPPQARKIMRLLVHRCYLRGYYSENDYYYPPAYFAKILFMTFEGEGRVKLDDFSHFPSKFLRHGLEEVLRVYHLELVRNTRNSIVYSFSHLITHLSEESNKRFYLDLSQWFKHFSHKDYQKIESELLERNQIIKQYHTDQQYLTITGKNHLITYLTHSKALGYFSAYDVSEKVGIPVEIVINFFKNHTEPNIGVYSTHFTEFFYNKYITKLIKAYGIKSVIKKLSRKLKKAPEILQEELNRNRLAIIQEIMDSKKISLSKYSDKLGIGQKDLKNLLNNMKLFYVQLGDILLFDQEKINAEKRSIKKSIVELVDQEGMVDIKESSFRLSNIICYEITRELIEDGEIRGILYPNEQFEGYTFLSEEQVEALFEAHKYKISLPELFPEKAIYLEAEKT